MRGKSAASPFFYLTLPFFWSLWVECLPAWLYYIDVGYMDESSE